MEKNQLYVTACKKIIISDLLFYLQNKVHQIANDDIVKICANIYDEAYVWEEKTKFFEAIGQRPIKSRSNDKKVKDLNDLLAEIRSRDDNDEFQPTCVAIELSNLPQSLDGSVPNAQILGTLHRMRKECVTKDSLERSLASFRAEVILAFKSVAAGN